MVRRFSRIALFLLPVAVLAVSCRHGGRQTVDIGTYIGVYEGHDLGRRHEVDAGRARVAAFSDSGIEHG